MLPKRRTKLSWLPLALALACFAPDRAVAGCGCDHPPPDWTLVMPPFGSPGKTITIFADGGAFVPQQIYSVEFEGPVVEVTATVDDRLEVSVPSGVEVGPISLRVRGQDYDHSYPASAFTALSHPRKIKDRDGVFHARSYKGAVGTDGTLYLALSLRDVRRAMQFTLALLDLPLAFGADDVVIYNSDGVDLTLFMLDLDDPSVKQWGSYYGWSVEGDSGLQGDWYEGQSGDSDDVALVSNLFTYWRHEFETYAAAHAAGGSHEVGEFGYHPDGTLHVDHNQLVIAINGLERDDSAPGDLSLAQPLDPGDRRIDVAWVSLGSEHPLEISETRSLVDDANGPTAEALEEVLFQED